MPRGERSAGPAGPPPTPRRPPPSASRAFTGPALRRSAVMFVLLVVSLLVGQWARFPDTQLSLLWPAVGIAVWWFLDRRGRAQWVLDSVLVVGSVTAVNYYVAEVSLTVSGTFALVNLVHAGLGGYLLRHGGSPEGRTARASDPARLLLASLTVSLVSGSLVAAASVALLDEDAVPAFLLVLVRNTTGTFLVLMVALTVVRSHRLAELVGGPRTWEWVGVVLTGIAVYAVLFGFQPSLPLAFLVLPLLVWVGSRHGTARTTALTVGLGVMAATLTLLGHGTFSVIGSAATRAGVVQSFLLVTVLTATTLAVTQEDRDRTAATLRSAQRALVESIDASLIGNGFVLLAGDRAGQLVRPNPALRRLLRTDAAPLPVNGVPVPADATCWLSYLRPDDALLVRGVLTELRTGTSTDWTGELQHHLGDGTQAWAEVHLSTLPPHVVDNLGEGAADVHGAVKEEGGPDAVVAQFLDITERKDAEARLLHLALHDELTGLPNRVLLRDRIDFALGSTRRSRSQVALIFLDLDRFKSINDSFGHDAGDRVLQVVAGRLLSALRPEDTVARIGGDEFVVCCPDLDGEAAMELSERLVAAVSEPVTSGEQLIPVGVSAGLTLSRPGDTASTLLQQSDTAMYSAKRAGRGRVESFAQALAAQANRNLHLYGELRDALREGQFVLHYQPIVDIATGTITACEALVRWQHPTRGLLLPETWLDVAEDSDLMVQLGEWVLHRACRDMVGIAEQVHPMKVHINVSGRQLTQAGIVEHVASGLAGTGQPSHLVVLELTETHLVEIGSSLLSDFNSLKQLGVELAVDDFGTGYSSLTQLVQLPVDSLKIDRSFVSSAGRDERAVAVIRGVLAMADALGLGVVAEGVQTPVQAAMLQDMGCDTGQGYLWSPPVELGRFRHLLTQDPRERVRPPPQRRSPGRRRELPDR